MQRDSLSKSLPRIIPRRERFALLIEIEIITSARARARCIMARDEKDRLSPESHKTAMLRSNEYLVIGIAGKDHPRSSPSRDQI